MRSITHSADIAFARDDARSILPAMVACLIGFVCLLLSFSISLSAHVGDSARAASASFQVEVPQNIARDAGKMKRIIETIRNTDGVEKTRVIDHAAMQDILKPWLGGDIMLGALDVPVLIDVTSDMNGDTAAVNADALKERLSNVGSGITIHAHGPWQRDVERASQLIHACFLGLAFLLMGCVVGMVMLLSRTGLKLHFKTVSLLHLFGATDDYILKQFQWNTARLVARGAVVGVGIAILAFFVLKEGITVGESALLPAISFSFGHVVLWILLPVFASIMAMMVARFTVQHMLANMH